MAEDFIPKWCTRCHDPISGNSERCRCGAPNPHFVPPQEPRPMVLRRGVEDLPKVKVS